MIHSQKLADEYAQLKNQVPDLLLLMQVGSFLQVMGNDAKTVSQVTGIQLKLSGTPDTPLVSGGFPVSGLDSYVGKLARAGLGVAIALQGADKRRSICERILVTSHAPA